MPFTLRKETQIEEQPSSPQLGKACEASLREQRGLRNRTNFVQWQEKGTNKLSNLWPLETISALFSFPGGTAPELLRALQCCVPLLPGLMTEICAENRGLCLARETVERK